MLPQIKFHQESYSKKTKTNKWKTIENNLQITKFHLLGESQNAVHRNNVTGGENIHRQKHRKVTSLTIRIRGS